jgi:hypothetical protein
VRTHRDENAQPQYEYYWPYVAIDPCHQDPSRSRRVQLLQLLHQLKSPNYVDTAKAALLASELLGVLQILWVARSHLQEMPAAFEELTAAATACHGPRVRAIRAVIEERIRIDVINSRRAAVSDPDHRFLLALLLNLREKTAILDAIKKWYGVEDPYELLMRWVRQLSGTSRVGVEFDELNTFLFERLLRGETIHEVLRSLEAKYAYEDVQHQKQELIRHCESLQSSEVFRSLLGSWSVPPVATLLKDVADVAMSRPDDTHSEHALIAASSVVPDRRFSGNSGRSELAPSGQRLAPPGREGKDARAARNSSVPRSGHRVGRGRRPSDGPHRRG